jgi:hypothetical protein
MRAVLGYVYVIKLYMCPHTAIYLGSTCAQAYVSMREYTAAYVVNLRSTCAQAWTFPRQKTET